MNGIATPTENIKDDLKDLPFDHKIIDVEKTPEKGSSWLKENSSSLISLAIVLIFTAYFCWATHYYIKETGYGWDLFDSSTCDGYGLLVILYCFYMYGVFYSYIGKPFIVPLIYKHVWKPTALFLGNIRYGPILFYLSVLVAAIAYLAVDTRDNRQRLIPVSGLCIFLVIGFILSSNKSMIHWRTVLWGIILQVVFGLLTIRWRVGRNILQCVGDKFNILMNYAFEGAVFTYGDDLVNNQGIFAFRSLSTIYLICFLANILYYYGIMQKIVGTIGNFLHWIMGTSICESVNAAANVFLGQVEAPLTLAPYLKDLTDSEIHSIMTAGFAMVSGSVMAAYVSYGARAQDLITSSIMSAPATLCFSKLMVPETEEVRVHKKNVHTFQMEFESVLDAASKGAIDAFKIVAGIIASVIAFLACVYCINGILGWLGILVGFVEEGEIWSLEIIVGKIFIPVSYVMGVPWDECEKVGTLIGIKTMVNEFVAFERMHQMLISDQLTERTKIIATYAICGFSNPSSIGIQVSALTALMPNKREAITRLVFKAFLGGALVCFMTACIAGILMPDDEI